MSDSDSEEGDHASAIMMQQLVKLHFPGKYHVFNEQCTNWFMTLCNQDEDSEEQACEMDVNEVVDSEARKSSGNNNVTDSGGHSVAARDQQPASLPLLIPPTGSASRPAWEAQMFLTPHIWHSSHLSKD
ncbi:unnamed protein product [Sphagnum jensenii]|uniref:PPPDE domain-containing protein n=1 Tax=Sphagnum jensenii TaxID=128206 RepID=A0ABP0W0R0_9BRYO